MLVDAGRGLPSYQASVDCEVPLQLLIESVLLALVNELLLQHLLSLKHEVLLELLADPLDVPLGPAEYGEDVPPDGKYVCCLDSAGHGVGVVWSEV